jgi:hypothetical protein
LGKKFLALPIRVGPEKCLSKTVGVCHGANLMEEHFRRHRQNGDWNIPKNRFLDRVVKEGIIPTLCRNQEGRMNIQTS